MKKSVLLCDRCEHDEIALERIVIKSLKHGSVTKDLCDMHFQAYEDLFDDRTKTEKVEAGMAKMVRTIGQGGLLETKKKKPNYKCKTCGFKATNPRALGHHYREEGHGKQAKAS